MNEFTEGQLTEMCQMVFRESKPSALALLKKVNLNRAENICIKEGCEYWTKEIDRKWREFWVFKRKEMLEVIKLLPEVPKTKLDHYLLGAIFGYSNNAICDYLKNLKE